MTSVSDDLVEECCLAILHDKMHISHLMVHTQQIEKTRIIRMNRKFKREEAYEGGTS